MRDEGAKRVKRMLSNDPKDTFVSLMSEEVDDSDCVQVSAAIRANAHIIGLLMDNNMFGPKGLQLLLDAIATHPTLKKLWLHNNNINDVGCQMIAERLLAKSHTHSPCWVCTAIR